MSEWTLCLLNSSFRNIVLCWVQIFIYKASRQSAELIGQALFTPLALRSEGLASATLARWPMWLPLLCPPHRRDCWHLCRCCIASHAVHLLQIPTDSLDPTHRWPAPRDILSESRSGPHTFKGKRSRSAARNCSVPMTCRSLHYTVSVSSPCWFNPSQPPKGCCRLIWILRSLFLFWGLE